MKMMVFARGAPDAQQLALQRLAGLRVERCEWLVHQQHFRIVGQAAGDRDTLLHAAGEFVRIAIGEGREADQIEIMPRDLATLPCLQPRDIEPELDVLRGGTPGKQRVLLKHDATVPCRPFDRPSIEQDAAAGRRRQAAQQIEQCRFPAATWANKGQELAEPYVERDILQRGEAVRRPASLAANDKLLTDLLEADLDRRHRASAVLPGR